MQVVVAVNGTYRHPERVLGVVDLADLVIAADGGANWLAAQARTPQVIVGDMDSVEPAVLSAIEAGGGVVKRYRPDKDETDTELALIEALARGAEHITIVGALGGRIDHELANVNLLAMESLWSVSVMLFDGVSYTSLIRRRCLVCGCVGDIVSLIPLGGDAHGIVTAGLEYPLRSESLRLGAARGVSNVLTATEAMIEVKEGNLLLVHTPLAYLED